MTDRAASRPQVRKKRPAHNFECRERKLPLVSFFAAGMTAIRQRPRQEMSGMSECSPEQHIVEDRQLLEDQMFWKVLITPARERSGALSSNRLASSSALGAVGVVEPGQDVEQTGLACPGWVDDGEQLAAIHTSETFVQDLVAAEGREIPLMTESMMSGSSRGLPDQVEPFAAPHQRAGRFLRKSAISPRGMTIRNPRRTIPEKSSLYSAKGAALREDGQDHGADEGPASAPAAGHAHRHSRTETGKRKRRVHVTRCQGIQAPGNAAITALIENAMSLVPIDRNTHGFPAISAFLCRQQARPSRDCPEQADNPQTQETATRAEIERSMVGSNPICGSTSRPIGPPVMSTILGFEPTKYFALSRHARRCSSCVCGLRPARGNRDRSGLLATKESEIAAKSMGIPAIVQDHRVSISAVMGGVAGGLYALASVT